MFQREDEKDEDGEEEEGGQLNLVYSSSYPLRPKMINPVQSDLEALGA